MSQCLNMTGMRTAEIICLAIPIHYNNFTLALFVDTTDPSKSIEKLSQSSFVKIKNYHISHFINSSQTVVTKSCTAEITARSFGYGSDSNTVPLVHGMW